MNIIRYMRAHLIDNLFLISVTLVVVILQVFTSMIHAFAFNALLKDGIKEFLLIYAMGFILWIIFLIGVYHQKIYQVKLIQKMLTSLKVDVTDKISSHHYQSFNQSPMSKYASWYTKDIAVIEKKGFSNIYILIEMILLCLVSLFALSQFHHSLMIVTLVFALILSYAPKYFSKQLNRSLLSFSRAKGMFHSRINNLLNGFNVLYFANKTDIMKHFVVASSDDLDNQKIKFTKTQRHIESIISFLSVVAQLVILILNGIFIYFGQLTFGTLASTNLIAINVFNSLSRIGAIQLEIENANLLLSEFELHKVKQDHHTKRIFGPFKELEIKHLKYCDKTSVIFEDISFKIKSGEKCVITGLSANDKFILIQILLGMIKDYKGSILLNGTELNKIGVTCLHKYIGYIDNENYMFAGTLRDNMTLWDDYYEHHLNRIMKKSQLHEFENRLDYNAHLLSDQEKQRVSIARELLQEKPILIIDDELFKLDEKKVRLIEKELLSDTELTLITFTEKIKKNVKMRYDQIINLAKHKQN